MFIKKENSFIKTNGRKLNTKKIEGVTLDSFYFTEYGIEYGNFIFNIFNKTQKSEKLLSDLKTNDLSLRGHGMAAVASFLGYSLDKIFNFFISLKNNSNFIKITTVDGQSIEVTEGMEILTINGYKKASEILLNDKLMIVLGSSFSFKSGNGNINNITITNILDSIELKFGKDGFINISKLSGDEKKIMYLLGLNPDEEGFINYKEFKTAQKFFSEKKKKKHSDKKEKKIDNDYSKIINKIFVKKFFAYKKIKTIEKINRNNIVVFNINTYIAENIIINNFIIRQNS